MNYATRAHSGLAGSVDDGELLRDGFCLIRELLNSAELVSLRTAINVDLRDLIAESANRRGLLDRSPNIAELAASTRVTALLNELADGSWFAVRAVLFDKTPEANWHVRWHQDQTIAVRKRLEVDGFDGWSEKEGGLSHRRRQKCWRTCCHSGCIWTMRVRTMARCRFCPALMRPGN